MAVKLRERPKGWYVLIDWRGQRKAKFFGADKKAAKGFADKLAARLKWAEQSGEPIALSQPDQAMPTVKAYLTEWLTVYAKAHCKASTATDYGHAVKGHLVPALGDRLLHEVTRGDIKRLIATLIAKGRKKQTIHNILTPLKEAFHHAVDDGLVSVNPVSSMGRLVATREGADSHISPLSADEVKAFLTKAKDTAPCYYPLFLAAVRTGMRQGELIGLQWGDIDFRGRFIEVRRGIVRRKETTTKTHRIRRVDLSPQLAGVLQEMKETRSLEASLAGTPIPEWVFLSTTGRRVSETVLRNVFYYCLEKAELRRVRFHDLRHTFASLLIQQGANPKYIQETLGHGSISVTMDIYSHLFEGDHRHQVSRLDDPQDKTVNNEGSAGDSATQAQPAVTDDSQVLA